MLQASLPLHLKCMAVVLALLTGCSTSNFRDRTTDYHLAQSANNPLPTNYAERDAMPVPTTDNRPQEALQNAPRPTPLRTLNEASELVTQRSGDQGAWLLILRSPSEVWPSLREFAQSRDLALTSANPSQGQLVLAADSASRLPAQHFHLRQGVRRGTAEIHLNSYAANQVLPWSDYDQNRLNALADYLQVSLQEESASVSLRAQSLQDDQLVRLTDRDGREVLVLQLEFGRAWAELVNLLEEEFNDTWQQVTDLNRNEGRIYLNYVPQKLRPQGFFSRLFGRSPQASNFSYQLYLTEYNEALDLVLETNPGQAAPEDIELELLTWLERQLR